MHKGRGRPPIGGTALSNEVKVRLSDKTLASIDAYAEQYGCKGRAETIRMILDGVFQMMEIARKKSHFSKD